MDDACTACSPDEIREILQSKRISTLFQPVVGIEQKTIVGFEAFSRAKLDDERTVNSSNLFAEGVSHELLADLDGLCCINSLNRFKKFLAGHAGLALFLNIDGRVLEQDGCAEHFLTALTKESGVPSANIAVEVSASDITSPNVMDFMRQCRSGGYLLSVDKVDRKVPVLEVLLEAKPDYVKLGRNIWENPEDPLYNLENLKLINRACGAVGCQPIAIGVEKEEDALYLLQCNMHLHQGYFYTLGRSKKKKQENGADTVSGFQEAIEHVHSKFTGLKKDSIGKKKVLFEQRHKLLQRTVSKFSDRQPGEFDNAIKAIMTGRDDIVSMFIVDERGMQVTERIPSDGFMRTSKSLGAVHTRGADHSMMDYHLHLLMGYERFVSPPAASPFLQEQTTVIAVRFFNGFEKLYILCVEFKDS